jgi:hypothetical protein
MKLITTNIFDFTDFYKFGFKYINKESVIDTLNNTLNGKELLEKTGFFEEDFDIFFLEISNDLFNEKNHIIKLSFIDVLNIIPLTEKGKNSLSNKLPDFKLSNPLDIKFSKLLFDERNKELSINGANRLLASFDIPEINILDTYQNDFLISLAKYSEDLNSELDTLMDSLVFYERSRPYPLSDIGFLYDVGGITMSRFKITEEDIRSRDLIKEKDITKYEYIEEIIAFSKYLQSVKDDKIWSNFLTEYYKNEKLKNLNQDLNFVDNDNSINNILIIAYYQKFRYLFRNTSNLGDEIIKKIIKKFHNNTPKETTISLYLIGMFFGALKFKDIYYYSKELSITSTKKQKKELEVKEEISKTKTIREIKEWYLSCEAVSKTNKNALKSFFGDEEYSYSELKTILNNKNKKILTKNVDKELFKFMNN